MDKLDKILKDVLSKTDLSGATEAAQICYLANRWANGRFEAISFQKGCLKLRACNHCAAQEGQMLEEELKDYLKEVVEDKVQRIRWIVSKSDSRDKF